MVAVHACETVRLGRLERKKTDNRKQWNTRTRRTMPERRVRRRQNGSALNERCGTGTCARWCGAEQNVTLSVAEITR